MSKRTDFQRVNSSTIRLRSGAYFDILNPDASVVVIEDVAHALSHICRFTGHTREFYSVAQHSVLVSRVVKAGHAFAGLMHDASEALIGDVAKPLKCLLPDYQVIEKRVEASVFRRFGLPIELPHEVHEADMVLLATEKRDLMGAEQDLWELGDGFAPLEERIQPVAPGEAFAMFMNRYHELAGHVMAT